MSHLNLFYPQWQGAGKKKDIYYGAVSVYDRYLSAVPTEKIKIIDNDDLKLERNIWGFQEILLQTREAAGVVGWKCPDHIFTLGGGCDTELAPVSYLNNKYIGDIAIIWFDAHGDLNTPESSVSKTFHGMPLRTLLGEGDKYLLDECFSVIEARQLIMVGTRDLDPPEASYIDKHLITVVPSAEADADHIISAIKKKGYSHAYVHIDLDVIDPTELPGVKCPSPGGMELDMLYRILLELQGCFSLVGMSLLEYSSTDAANIDKLERFIELGKSLGQHL